MVFLAFVLVLTYSTRSQLVVTVNYKMMCYFCFKGNCAELDIGINIISLNKSASIINLFNKN